MNKVKTIFRFGCASLFAGALVFSLSACGDDSSSNASNGGDGENIESADSNDSNNPGSSGGSAASVKSSGSKQEGMSSASTGSSSESKNEFAPKYDLDDPCGRMAQCYDMLPADTSTWHYFSKDSSGEFYSYSVKFSKGDRHVYTYSYSKDGSRTLLENLYINSDDYDYVRMSSFLRLKGFCTEYIGSDVDQKSCDVSSFTQPEEYDPSWPKPTDFMNPDIQYGEMTDARNGKVYKTIEFEGVRWMAQNLDLDYHYGTAESMCYKGDPKNCALYGRLYRWSAAMDSAGIYSDDAKGCGAGANCKIEDFVRGICPEGWHLPSRDEYYHLFKVVSDSGHSLGAKGIWPDVVKTADDLGFSILPGGHYDYGFNSLDSGAYFWSSDVMIDEYRADYAGSGGISGGTTDMNRGGFNSVRCVEDDVALLDSIAEVKKKLVTGSFVDARDNRTYGTIVIKNKTWMSENLQLSYNEGSAKSSCDDNDISCTKYGRDYNWLAAIDSAGLYSDAGTGCNSKESCKLEEPVRGICPEGWHLPTFKDLDELIDLYERMPYYGEYETRGLHNVDYFEWTGFGSLDALPPIEFHTFPKLKLWSSRDESYSAYSSEMNRYGYSYYKISKTNERHVRCIKDE